MVTVSVEARSGAARFAVSVRAGSFRRAVSLAQGLRPDDDSLPRFLAVPVGARAEIPAARATIVELPAGMAA